MAPDRIRESTWHNILMAGCLALLVVLLVQPIALTLVGGFQEDPVSGGAFTFRHFEALFANPLVVESLLNSLKVAVGTTTLSILIALPLAVFSAGYQFPMKRALNALILVPMILPPFVGAIGMRSIIGREGAINAMLGTDFDVLGQSKVIGVIVMQAFSLYPIIYLNTTAALANLDPALNEAAQNLGAGWWRRFLRVTLPLVRPGIFAGATIVFIASLTELGTPLVFDYYTVAPVRIFNGLKDVENNSEPYALTAVLLVMAVGLYGLSRAVLGGRGHAMYSKASRAGGEVTLEGWRGWGATLLFVGVTSCAVLPHLGVILNSVASPGSWYNTVLPQSWTASHYKSALGAPDSFRSITNSLWLSCAAMVFDIVLGVLIGYLLVRTKARGRWLLDSLCMLPLAVPGLVMAFGYVAMSLRFPFGKDGPLSGLASIVATDPNPIPFLIVAYGIRRLPYIVRSTVAGLEQTSGELEEAAINLGASRMTAVRRVILPLILANLIAGGLLVFSFSMLEVSDSLILAQQTEDFPFTKAIWAFADRYGDGPNIASAMGVWGMALLAVTLCAASVLLGKKLGSIFRV